MRSDGQVALIADLYHYLIRSIVLPPGIVSSSPTQSTTQAPSPTESATASQSQSLTPSLSSSQTQSLTQTISQTISQSSSRTGSQTSSSSQPRSPSQTPSPTQSPTPNVAVSQGAPQTRSIILGSLLLVAIVVLACGVFIALMRAGTCGTAFPPSSTLWSIATLSGCWPVPLSTLRRLQQHDGERISLIQLGGRGETASVKQFAAEFSADDDPQPLR